MGKVDSQAKVVEAVREKRADFDQPVVDAPVPVVDVVERVEGLGEKAGVLVFEFVDGQAVVSIGKERVVLGREGVFQSQRALNRFAANL